MLSARRAVLGLTVIALPLSAAAVIEEPDRSIVTDEVRRASVAEVVDVPATVAARDAVTLAAPARGRLVTLEVESGDSVHTGDLIGVIDSPVARKRLANARAALHATREFDGIDPESLDWLFDDIEDNGNESFEALREAAEQIPIAQLRAAALEKIEDKQDDFEDALDNAERLADQVQDTIEEFGDALEALNGVLELLAQSAVDAAQATVDALTLRAPIDGVVQIGGTSKSASSSTLAQLLSDKTPPGPLRLLLPAIVGTEPPAGPSAGAGVDDVVEAGDPVEAGTAIATIVDTSGLTLIGSVDETDILLVEPGVDADVELEAAPRVAYTASVTSTDLLPTTSARGGVAYRIRLDLTGEVDPTPLPGMTGVARLRVGNATDAVAVPASALTREGIHDFVWLVRDDKAVRQPVKVGVTGTDQVEILEGLQPGDHIVVSGVDKVREGMTVR